MLNCELEGLESLTIRGLRPGSDAKQFRVTLQPSIRINPGVYIGTNEHFETDPESATDQLMAILKKSWTSAQKHSKDLAETLLDRVIQEKR